MRKFLLLALPLAMLVLAVGCDENQRSAQSSNAPTLTPANAEPAAPAPMPMQQSNRRSTTQALPAGENYIHVQDLTGGPLAAAKRTEG
jgi:hypothetical protein